MTRLKDVAIINRASLPESTDADEVVRYVDISSVDDVGRMHEPDELRFADAPSRARRLVREGDSIVSTVRTYLRAVAFIQGDVSKLVVSTGFATITPRAGVDARLLYWTVRGSQFIEEVVSRSVGVSYPAITPTELGAVHLASLPPLRVQQEIAAVLDRRTAEIDELLSENERLLRLLWERRSAALFDAVTGRSRPGPRRTVVPWVESIPASWDAVRLIRVAQLGSGHTPARNRPDLWMDCTIPWITTGEVVQIRSDEVEVLTETREMVSEAGVAASAATVHPAGTAVLCRTAASAGYSAIMGLDMATSQDFATWTCGPRLRPEYLLYCLRAMRSDLLGRLAMGSTHRTIYMPEIKSIVIPLPPVAEQTRIVEELRRQFDALDTTRKEVERQIGLLREHRQALITAAANSGLDGLDRVA